jgi:rare lipoprotein A
VTFIRVHIRFVIAVVVTVVVGLGCASSPRFAKNRSSENSSGSVTAPSSTIPSRPAVSEGIASYYAHDFHGKKTANGEIFNMRALTAAHRSYPFNTKMRVTNLDNGRTVVVRVNDRGPFKLERITDLSLGAAEALDMTKTGTAKVRLEVLEWGKE